MASKRRVGAVLAGLVAAGGLALGGSGRVTQEDQVVRLVEQVCQDLAGQPTADTVAARLGRVVHRSPLQLDVQLGGGAQGRATVVRAVSGGAGANGINSVDLTPAPNVRLTVGMLRKVFGRGEAVPPVHPGPPQLQFEREIDQNNVCTLFATLRPSEVRASDASVVSDLTLRFDRY